MTKLFNVQPGRFNMKMWGAVLVHCKEETADEAGYKECRNCFMGVGDWTNKEGIVIFGPHLKPCFGACSPFSSTHLPAQGSIALTILWFTHVTEGLGP